MTSKSCKDIHGDRSGFMQHPLVQVIFNPDRWLVRDWGINLETLICSSIWPGSPFGRGKTIRPAICRDTDRALSGIGYNWEDPTAPTLLSLLINIMAIIQPETKHTHKNYEKLSYELDRDWHIDWKIDDWR